MRLICGCGWEGFSEAINTNCPECNSHIGFHTESWELFSIALSDLVAKHKHSVLKHGDWADYTPEQIFEAVAGEFDEYREAFITGAAHGKHGQIDELGDVIVTALKGIRRLKCLQ